MKGMPTNNATLVWGSQYGVLQGSEFNSQDYNQSHINLFYIHLPDYYSLCERLKQFLNKEEKKRALKYFKDQDKSRYIICRSLLKGALAQHTGLNIDDISIDTLPNKKPYLSTHPQVHFNLSHSGVYAVLAVCPTPIGIDIEHFDPNYSFQQTLAYIFNTDEIAFLNNSLNETITFFKLWTRKESFVKAIGRGIDDEFKNIPCLDGSHKLHPNLIVPNHPHWQGTDFQINSHYQGSLVFGLPLSKKIEIKAWHFPTEPSKLLELFSSL